MSVSYLKGELINSPNRNIFDIKLKLVKTHLQGQRQRPGQRQRQSEY